MSSHGHLSSLIYGGKYVDSARRQEQVGAAIDEALAGRPEEVTQRRKPAAVILPADEYYRLVNAAGSERQFHGPSAQV